MVDLFECMMMHGLTNPKFVTYVEPRTIPLPSRPQPCRYSQNSDAWTGNM